MHGDEMLLVNRVRMGALALSLASLALGCTEKGRSLIPVEVSVSNVDAVTRVRVLALQGSTRLVDTGPMDWPGGTLKLGLYISKDISGPVHVVGCALGAAGLIAANDQVITFFGALDRADDDIGRLGHQV